MLATMATGSAGASAMPCRSPLMRVRSALHRDPPALGPQLPFLGVHRGAPFQRRSSSALLTTLTLLKAIAAPAITGLSKPNAASGMPTTL